jgi:hypothetical protein
LNGKNGLRAPVTDPELLKKMEAEINIIEQGIDYEAVNILKVHEIIPYEKYIEF